MVKKLGASNIDVPESEDLPTMAGGYTGFNGVNLQECYTCRRFTARRSQIARAWGKPVIQRSPNGDLLATGFKSRRQDPNPQYPEAGEEAGLSVSRDQGVTWSEMRPLNLPGRPTQFTVLSDGAAIMTTQSMWQPGNQMLRSDDGCQKFSKCNVAWDDFAVDLRPGVLRGYGETNGIIEMPDGSLIATCYTYSFPIETHTDLHGYVIRSTDRGRTWSDASFATHTDEFSLLRLRDGKLLALVRLDTSYSREVLGQGGQSGEGGDQLATMESADDGRTWTKPVPLGLGMAQIPGFPLLLDDGRILLVYGNRQFPFGVQAIASLDRGATWDLENFLMLAYASWDNYGGHPRSIIMPDGSIMTGYYARYFKDFPDTVNGDMVSHCLHWQAPANWPGT